jgi:hypothetical protein
MNKRFSDLTSLLQEFEYLRLAQLQLGLWAPLLVAGMLKAIQTSLPVNPAAFYWLVGVLYLGGSAFHAFSEDLVRHLSNQLSLSVRHECSRLGLIEFADRQDINVGMSWQKAELMQLEISLFLKIAFGLFTIALLVFSPSRPAVAFGYLECALVIYVTAQMLACFVFRKRGIEFNPWWFVIHNWRQYPRIIFFARICRAEVIGEQSKLVLYEPLWTTINSDREFAFATLDLKWLGKANKELLLSQLKAACPAIKIEHK